MNRAINPWVFFATIVGWAGVDDIADIVNGDNSAKPCGVSSPGRLSFMQCSAGVGLSRAQRIAGALSGLIRENIDLSLVRPSGGGVDVVRKRPGWPTYVRSRSCRLLPNPCLTPPSSRRRTTKSPADERARAALANRASVQILWNAIELAVRVEWATTLQGSGVRRKTQVRAPGGSARERGDAGAQNRDAERLPKCSRYVLNYRGEKGAPVHFIVRSART